MRRRGNMPFGECLVYEYRVSPRFGGQFPRATDQFGGLSISASGAPGAMARAIRFYDEFQRNPDLIRDISEVGRDAELAGDAELALVAFIEACGSCRAQGRT